MNTILNSGDFQTTHSLHISEIFATQTVVHRQAALASPGSLSETQTLKSLPRPTESEPACSQVRQVMCTSVKSFKSTALEHMMLMLLVCRPLSSVLRSSNFKASRNYLTFLSELIP